MLSHYAPTFFFSSSNTDCFTPPSLTQSLSQLISQSVDQSINRSSDRSVGLLYVWNLIRNVSNFSISPGQSVSTSIKCLLGYSSKETPIISMLHYALCHCEWKCIVYIIQTWTPSLKSLYISLVNWTGSKSHGCKSWPFFYALYFKSGESALNNADCDFPTVGQIDLRYSADWVSLSMIVVLFVSEKW